LAEKVISIMGMIISQNNMLLRVKVFFTEEGTGISCKEQMIDRTGFLECGKR
jgi:hypothetical protein